MDAESLEALEMDLVVEALRGRYGYDFAGYARGSLRRRLRRHCDELGLAAISELVPRICHDVAAARALVGALTVNVSEMFRDPPFYRALRERVVPHLRTYPFVRIWHAGCATGEEVYSLAILLREEGLYARSQIYATDLNASAVEAARRGVYPADRRDRFARAYREAGGRGRFADYCVRRGARLVLDPALRRNVAFGTHNLATDASLGEMQLVLCRNVLIYFERALQDRVLNLLADSLVRGGVLCLGRRETLALSPARARFVELDPATRIYRKTAGRLTGG